MDNSNYFVFFYQYGNFYKLSKYASALTYIQDVTRSKCLT